MSATKDDYGLTARASASLLARLRDIDNHYLMRAYDHSTLKRAHGFIHAVWQMHQRGTVDLVELEKLLTDAKLI